MTVALRDPALVSSIIPVDNAPVDAVLESNFAKYVQGMKKIEEARVSKQPEADSILKLYEEVCSNAWHYDHPVEVMRIRLSRFDSSC